MNAFQLGAANAGYGYYSLSGGQLITNEIGIGGGNGNGPAGNTQNNTGVSA